MDMGNHAAGKAMGIAAIGVMGKDLPYRIQ